MSQNQMVCTILEDGRVKIETDGFSTPVHASAEAALQYIAKELGGGATRTRRVGAHTHAHGHEHSHDHDHEHDHTHQ